MYLDNTSKTTQYTWIIYVIQVKLGLRLSYLKNSRKSSAEDYRPGWTKQGEWHSFLQFAFKTPHSLVSMARKSPGYIAWRFSLRNGKEERNEGREATHSCVFWKQPDSPADHRLPLSHGNTSSNGAQAASTQHAESSWLMLFDSSKKVCPTLDASWLFPVWLLLKIPLMICNIYSTWREEKSAFLEKKKKSKLDIWY